MVPYTKEFKEEIKEIPFTNSITKNTQVNKQARKRKTTLKTIKLLKEIKDTEVKISCVHGLGDSTVKILMLSKAITESMQCLSKSVTFFAEIEKSILKFIWICKGSEQPKQSWTTHFLNSKVTTNRQ